MTDAELCVRRHEVDCERVLWEWWEGKKKIASDDGGSVVQRGQKREG